MLTDSTARAMKRLAEELGFAVTETKRGHLMCVHPHANPVLMPSKFPTKRHIHNSTTRLRRAVRNSASL